ncbi:unnamed protein product, partial [Owenia fusiformis]
DNDDRVHVADSEPIDDLGDLEPLQQCFTKSHLNNIIHKSDILIENNHVQEFPPNSYVVKSETVGVHFIERCKDSFKCPCQSFSNRKFCAHVLAVARTNNMVTSQVRKCLYFTPNLSKLDEVKTQNRMGGKSIKKQYKKIIPFSPEKPIVETESQSQSSQK